MEAAPLGTTPTVLAFPQPESNPTAQPTHEAAAPSLFIVPQSFHSPSLNADSLKAAFRRRANELGIDAERGSTGYQAAAVQAALRKRDHYRRTRALVEQHAATHSPDATRDEWIWPERPHNRRWELKQVRYLQWDNGSGAVDSIKVEQRARRDWFTIDSRFWVQGTPIRNVLPDEIDLHGHVDSPTEYVAIANVRRAAVEAETERDVERKYNRVELLNDLSPRRYFRMRRAA